MNIGAKFFAVFAAQQGQAIAPAQATPKPSPAATQKWPSSDVLLLGSAAHGGLHLLSTHGGALIGPDGPHVLGNNGANVVTSGLRLV